MLSRTSISLSLLAAALLGAAPGCATANDPAAPGPETGDLVLSLTQPGPHGEVFHLASATFDILHIESGVTTTIDGSGDSGELDVVLPPGLVTITLRDGWSLEKSTDGGATFQPVSALLGSPNPNALRVLANQPSFVQFAFLIRQTNGTLGITLGVINNPRELAGGISIQTATDGLAAYAVGGNRTLDFAVYFNLFSLASVTLPDGTKQHIYTAFGQQGSLGPTPMPTGALAAEFFNDSIGTYAGPIAHEMIGGFLSYTVAAKPDGTIELSGSLIGGATDIEFGPSPIDAVIPTIGPDGFPNDEFFYHSNIPFTQTSADGTITGNLRVRHLLETP
jgi:hypothetical protein